jgi:hypothetical protein
MFAGMALGRTNELARTWHSKALIGLCLGMILLLGAAPQGHAQSQNPPPLSPNKALFYKNHPEAWQRYLAALPKRPTGNPVARPQPAAPAFGGTWSAVTVAPTGLSNPLLLTDGTVMAAQGNTPNWFKLTPDVTGNYANGTWSQLASLPVINGTQYAPLYFASAVLPDGRVLIMGGEFNGSGTFAATNLGAIYDPVADIWTAVPAPPGDQWKQIGDAPSAVLANGTFLLGSCCGRPSVAALFDPVTLGWTSTAGPDLSDFQAESSYELLPDGSVLNIDTYPPSKGNGLPPTTVERYIPASGSWVPAGNTPVSLTDPGKVSCDQEIGPAVVRPDGTVVAFGGYSGCDNETVPDPIAIYASSTGTWSAGPNLPAICGPDGATICSLSDAPAALLPNGNILFAPSGIVNGNGNAPTLFFEFTGANTMTQVAEPIFNASTSISFFYNFLMLPTGQVLITDGTAQLEVYTPTGSADPTWAPAITEAPATIARSSTYPISGTQFSGRSEGAYFGDDAQAETNYPIIRITNAATGHVFYARSFGHSTMSIAPNAAGSTNFTVPATAETGASTLVVIANGIPSAPVSVTVTEPDLLVASVLPGSRSVQIGNTATVFATMINTAPGALDNCRISLAPPAPAGLTLSYQTTNPTTNGLIGQPNTPTTIQGKDGSQSFEIGFQSMAALSAPVLPLDFDCDGAAPAIILPGVNTVDLNFSVTPSPDIIALATAAGGVLTIPQSNASPGAFATATINAGAAGDVTVTADTGSATLPLQLTICPTNPSTAACLIPPAASVKMPYQPNSTQTYSIFAAASAPIAFAPGTSRVFLRFTEMATGIVRGSTSIAVQTD